MKRIVIIVSVIMVLVMIPVLISSCHNDPVVIDSDEKMKFLESSAQGYYSNGVEIFIYKDTLHQRCLNINRRSFRIQTNTQDSCLSLILDNMPNNLGVHIMASVNYFDTSKQLSSKLLLECSKIEQNKIWLWDAHGKNGFIIAVK